MSLNQRFISNYEISHEKCSETSPNFLSLHFVGPKKFRKFPPDFPQNFPPKNKRIHRRASARAQGEEKSPAPIKIKLAFPLPPKKEGSFLTYSWRFLTNS